MSSVEWQIDLTPAPLLGREGEKASGVYESEQEIRTKADCEREVSRTSLEVNSRRTYPVGCVAQY